MDRLNSAQSTHLQLYTPQILHVFRSPEIFSSVSVAPRLEGCTGLIVGMPSVEGSLPFAPKQAAPIPTTSTPVSPTIWIVFLLSPLALCFRVCLRAISTHSRFRGLQTTVAAQSFTYCARWTTRSS